MKNKKLIVLMWVFSLVPAIMVLVAWPRLPAQVPTNWGFNGQVSYGSKGTLWTLVGLCPLLALMLQFLPKADPKRRNYEKFQSIYDGFAVVFPLFMTALTAVILIETFRPGTLQVSRVVTVFVSLLMAGIGCILGKVKPNWFMGIRTPWALSDPDVWNKTHRLGGWVFFVSGVVTLPLALLAPEMVFFVVFFSLLMGGIVLTYVMSYLWYRQKTKGEE